MAVASGLRENDEVKSPLNIHKNKKSGKKEEKFLIDRHFTKEGENPFDSVEYDLRTSVITEPDGTVVFELKDVEVPRSWSELATNIVASKYFRKAGVPKTGHETSVKQVIFRIAHTLREAGEERGYFPTDSAAENFEAELTHLLLHQKGAFNSPVWFNCGLYHQYGIKGSGGNWYWDSLSGDFRQAANAYSHPQCSACFIQSVDDDLMSIFDLMKNEARLFKYGSGTGTNFSAIRGKQEKLSGGGTSSGLMSFLEVLDKGAGATKSGGTTRRAAKMVSLNMDHPEIVDFIDWKMKEEKKVRALIAAGYSSDFNGEAYHTISGQNANISVRVSDEFMRRALEGGTWETTMRTTGEVVERYNAEDLLKRVANAAWHCADPGVQFDDIINRWHTCRNTDRIYGSNPCSEYMFLNDSACNLASINLMKFLDEDGNFDVEGYRHAIRVFILAQEILVDFASYPTKRIAQNSHEYRPLGLGYANLGTLLMVTGVPYDSDRGRAVASALTAIMNGQAYKTSALIAREIGPFKGFALNREPMLEVMEMHRKAAYEISAEHCPPDLLSAAQEDWDNAVAAGREYGYRNAQATVIAPTGTIGLLMDCDTTGVEPDFALIKWKKLAGGGYFRIINQSIPPALRMLGYNEQEIHGVTLYIRGHGSLESAPHINPEGLRELGFEESEIKAAREYIARTQSLDGGTPFINPKSLLGRGLSDADIREAVVHVNGAGCVEGAPHLKPEHYPIFDCANVCGIGKRFIDPMGHIKMMAAVQPFISGSISKTVNLPKTVTVDEIENIIIDSWRLGLKAIALYRDGSKASQVLTTSNSEDENEPEKKSNGKSNGNGNGNGNVRTRTITINGRDYESTLPEWVKLRGQKQDLPKTRRGLTYELLVGQHKVYLRTGEYDDGSLGELFIDMWKEGSAYRSLMNCFAIAVSKGLQYGVPLEKYVESFSFTRFEPSGMTNHPNIRTCTSVMDLVFRILGKDYLNRTDFLHVKPEAGQEKPVRENGGKKKNMSIIAEQAAAAVVQEGEAHGAAPVNQLNQHLSNLMGDAPICEQCGHITVRNGACYKCLNCGNSIGCS